MTWPAYAIHAFVTLQRLAELALSNRNTSRLLQRGAHEVAPRHFPFLVAVHLGWLISLWLLGPGPPIEIAPLILFGLLQLGRIWVITTLGQRWTTRIIILPGAPLVRTGPYRFLDHPNYLIVAGEIAILPLVFDLPMVALFFSVLNGVALSVRIRAEDRALSALS